MDLQALFERWWEREGTRMPEDLPRKEFALRCMRAGAGLLLALQDKAKGAQKC